MATKEEISMSGFEIVAYAGDAKTAVMKALTAAQEGDFEEADKQLKDARKSIDDAHNSQTKILAEEAGGADMDVTFIMVHGQDTLMTTMLLIDETKYFVNVFKRLKALESKRR